MSEPLTNVQEPGFYSQVKESPNLFLAPATVNVIGLIGNGKDTKSVTSNLTRDTALDVQPLGAPATSVSNVYSTGVFKYPASSYGFAVEGSTGATGFAGLTGTTLLVTVGGVAEGMTFAGGTMAGAISQINAAFDNVNATNDGGILMLVSTDGQALEIGAGTANTILALTSGTVSSDIWWNPALTDPELAPQDETAFSVDMETPKVTADYVVKYYTSASQVYTDYGDPLPGNGLSLGAYAAFNAPGATVLAIRQFNPASGTTGAALRGEITAALKHMEAADIDVLVPMIPISDDTLTSPLYLQHVSKMSSKLERKERIAILGVDETETVIPLLGEESWESIMANLDIPASSGLESKRVVVVAPGIASVLLGNTDTIVDGTYVAAGFAGRIVAAEFDAATPMTRKTLATIDALDTPTRSRVDKNALTAMGVTVIEMKNGLAMIRRAVTANTASIASQEPSIVRSFDQIAAGLREFLENRFVGSKIVPNVTNTVLEAATQTYLNQKVSEEIIGAFRSIKAVRNATEPRQFDISFDAVPIFPFLWGAIDISISIQ